MGLSLQGTKHHTFSLLTHIVTPLNTSEPWTLARWDPPLQTVDFKLQFLPMRRP